MRALASGLRSSTRASTACPRRHVTSPSAVTVLHSVPDARRVIVELARVTRPGGYLHLIPEDYGMLHFQQATPYRREFWHVAPGQFGAATNTDHTIGRNAFGILAALGLEEIAIDYVVVDTLRVPRETFAAIFEAWRDGYTDALAELTYLNGTRPSRISIK